MEAMYDLAELLSSFCWLVGGFSPPDEFHQLLQRLPVVCGWRGAGSSDWGGWIRWYVVLFGVVVELVGAWGLEGCSTSAEVPQPVIENRRRKLASPVSWGTRRGISAAAVAGL
jgi:hypothetical protein